MLNSEIQWLLEDLIVLIYRIDKYHTPSCPKTPWQKETKVLSKYIAHLPRPQLMSNGSLTNTISSTILKITKDSRRSWTNEDCCETSNRHTSLYSSYRGCQVSPGTWPCLPQRRRLKPNLKFSAEDRKLILIRRSIQILIVKKYSKVSNNIIV